MMRRGFSIVELAIVIAMIGILSLLLFAGLRNSQVQARDDERQAKAQLIASSLEALYKAGNAGLGYNAGHYPSMPRLNDAIADGSIIELLPNIDDSVLSFSWSDSPNFKLKTILKPPYLGVNNNTENMTFIESEVGIDEFVYEPLMLDTSFFGIGDNDKWNYCRLLTQQCRRFNIYYLSEVDGTIKVIRSTNQ